MFGSSPPSITFDVTASDDASEIFLINGNFELIGKGIGNATFSAPAGLYKLKVRCGNTTVEKVIGVRDGMKPIVLDPVQLVTPVPLTNSATTNAAHEAAAAHAANQSFDVNARFGSEIVIVVRSSNSETTNPARGLKLLAMDGRTIADVETQGRIGGDSGPAIVTLSIAVNPDAYRLSLTEADGRRIEQMIVTSNAWQTQVFMFTGRSGYADLVNAAITIQKGFVPSDANLRLEQIALAAFRDDRKILSEAMHIASADAPPMLALLGALLLIREAKTSKEQTEDRGGTGERIDNRAAVAGIVANLRAALGHDSHPDVEAIAIGAGVPNPQYEFRSPPMFRASWRLLLKASAADPKLIPSSSFAARIATRLWGDGPWLLYLNPDDDSTVDRTAVWRSGAINILANIADVKFAAPPPAAMSFRFPLVFPLAPLLGYSAKIRALFTRRVRPAFPDPRHIVVQSSEQKAAPDIGRVRIQLDDTKRKLLVKRLGVPMSSIDAWLDEIRK
jgi:hypothetical protein